MSMDCWVNILSRVVTIFRVVRNGYGTGTYVLLITNGGISIVVLVVVSNLSSTSILRIIHAS